MRSVSDLMNLTGRVALIAGGAGHLGQAMAEALAEVGASVVLLDQDEAKLQEAAGKIRVANGGKISGLRCNLQREDEVLAVPSQIRETHGRLDVMIFAAALVGTTPLSGWTTPLEDQSLETWRQAFEVNLTSAFALCQKCAPLLREQGSGSIILVSSIYGMVAPDYSLYEGTSMGNPAAYAASKGGMLQLTRWLSSTLAPRIRVNSISPGGVFRGQPDEFVKKYEHRTPLGRMAKEEDLKGAALYLASDLSAYVTGQNLVVDGGWTAW